MKKVIKQWLALGLSLAVFASCSKDRSEPQSPSRVGGEVVTLSLNAEVSVDDSELRSINYKLGKNANGKIVPMPQFNDGQLEDVHTIIKSNRNHSVVKTLKWYYDAKSKKLVLAPKVKDAHGTEYTNNLEVSDFNNDGGVKWYISGMIGGVLDANTKTVKFEGTRVLNGVSGNIDEIVGRLNVPYAFGWTELTVDVKSQKVGTSYVSAQLPTSVPIKFSPLGSLIEYKLGNQQAEGAYTFTPREFTVKSNAFGDMGMFNLDTNLPVSGEPSVLPIWTELTNESTLSYKFANGQEPGVIDHNSISSKTYYAWAMPHATQPSSVSTVVHISGKSSRITTDIPFKWFTDYKAKATSQLIQGRVHSLTAKVISGRPVLPIEYVAENNLAGGEGLTYTITNATPQPNGVTGPLRFANSYSNDESGYYNGYKVLGKTHPWNPQGLDLQKAIDDTWGAGVYTIPTLDQWWGVWPSYQIKLDLWSRDGNYYDPFTNTFVQYLSNQPDPIAINSGGVPIKYGFSAEYYQNHNNTLYAIRFKSREGQGDVNIDWGESSVFFGDRTTLFKETYPAVDSDVFKCAYRYRWYGDFNRNSDNSTLSNGLIIDVVYLGEEQVPTSIYAIMNDAWWNDKQAKGLVISRTFPMPGKLGDPSLRNQNTAENPNFILSERGRRMYYFSKDLLGNGMLANVSMVHFYLISVYLQSRERGTLHYAYPVRPFYLHP